MTLEQYIRNKTAKFIRPLLLKSECEICKVEDTLELHHIKPFAELLTECLNNLQLDKMTNIEDYNELELENITNYMLGVQLQTQYLTLCNKCHKRVHEEMGALCEIGNNFRLHCEKGRKTRELVEKHRIDNIITPYLESMVDKNLYKEEQKELIGLLNVRANGRVQRSYTKLNEGLSFMNLPYAIIPKRTNSIRYWMLEKIG